MHRSPWPQQQALGGEPGEKSAYTAESNGRVQTILLLYVLKMRAVLLGMRLVVALTPHMLRAALAQRTAVRTLRDGSTFLVHMQKFAIYSDMSACCPNRVSAMRVLTLMRTSRYSMSSDACLAGILLAVDDHVYCQCPGRRKWVRPSRLAVPARRLECSG